MAAEEPARNPMQCALHTVLAQDIHDIKTDIKKGFDDILKRLGEGDVTLGTLKERVKRLELVVYGAVALVLTVVIIGGLSLLIKAVS